MRITAELITELVEHRINPLEERELCLGGLAIAALENLGAARNDFDAYDLSNNRIRRLEHFPKVPRLQSLYVAHNLVDSVDANNLLTNVPNLQHLELSHNAVADFRTLQQLAAACPNLSFLSLVGNPVCRRPGYRLAVIYAFATVAGTDSDKKKRNSHLQCLDYIKIKASERKQAAQWGVQNASQLQAADAATNTSAANTFTPGEGVPKLVTAHFTTEQKAYIRDLLASAESVQEMEAIEAAVQRGVLPKPKGQK